MKLIGIDVGGTFTDGIFYNGSEITVHKVHSTPKNQRTGVMNAVNASGYDLKEVDLFLHGTTVATNAVIEKNGSSVALITTKGFRDVLKIRRTTRGVLYDLQWDQPEELITRKYRTEVDERIDGWGNVIKPLNREELIGLVKKLWEDGIKAIAICFINSYANPQHELTAQKWILEEFPDLYVTCSNTLLCEWREFERMSTVSVAAYVGPLLENYLSVLYDEVKQRGYSKELLLMLSNGGVAPAFPVEKIAPRSLLSGPAAAAIALKGICSAIGEENVVSIDIGGTSTDIAIVCNGELLTRDEQEIEFGTVVHLPIIDVVTIGAGGGTIAHIDRGGMLNMGPQSAGAMPGPVCYDQGGENPTLTDANVHLGRLNREYLLGGKFAINASLSEKRIDEKIAKPLKLNTNAAAQGMIDIVNNNICNAIRRLTMNRGFDIREFALFACGGAGPLQAVDVAKNLGMTKVIVPRYPGITAAMGLLMSDVRYDYVKSIIKNLSDVSSLQLGEEFSTLVEQACGDLKQSGFEQNKQRITMYLDLRYAAQTHELTMQIEEQDISDYKAIARKFKELHQKSFGYSSELTAPLELVNIRVAGFGLLQKIELGGDGCASGDAKPIGTRRVCLRGMDKTVPVFAREELKSGYKGVGPCIIEQMDTTVLVDEGDAFEVDNLNNILITWESK